MTRRPLSVPAIAAVLFLATVLLYLPVLWHEFVIFDDLDYVAENPRVLQGLSWGNLGWAFTTTLVYNWHPLTVLSHMLDVSLFGENAGGHHAVSVVLHAINAALLFLVLKRFTGAFYRSAIVAGLFAWHPLHVESVAWVSERKDVLSTLFLLLTIWAYGNYVLNNASTASIRRRWYIASLLFFVLGLMSKPMVVTLPFALLLLDYWPLGRLAPPNRESAKGSKSPVKPTFVAIRQLLIEKIPFFILTIVGCLLTVYAQSDAIKPTDSFPVVGRLQNAIVSYATYLWKTVYPIDLIVFYPHPKSWPVGIVVISAALLSAISTIVVVMRKKMPALATGWCWYLGTLVPVIGLVQVGAAAMADRYTYIPHIGFFIMATWAAGSILPWQQPGFRKVGAALVMAILGTLCVLTSRQLEHWRNSETLFRHAVTVTPKNALANFNLGVSVFRQDRLDEALVYFYRVLEDSPTDPDAHRFIGQIYCTQGKIEDGAKHLMQAEAVYSERLERRMNKEGIKSAAYTYVGLALAQVTQRKYSDAVDNYRRAIELDPSQPVPYNELAWLLATCRDASIRNGPEAVRLAEKACELTDWKRVAFMGTLDASYAEAGRFEEAITMAQRVMRVGEEQHRGFLAELAKKRIELYRQGKAFHE